MFFNQVTQHAPKSSVDSNFSATEHNQTNADAIANTFMLLSQQGSWYFKKCEASFLAAENQYELKFTFEPNEADTGYFMAMALSRRFNRAEISGDGWITQRGDMAALNLNAAKLPQLKELIKWDPINLRPENLKKSEIEEASPALPVSRCVIL